MSKIVAFTAVPAPVTTRIIYLDRAIIAVCHTERPNHGMAADGYTKRSGAPTHVMVQLDGDRAGLWRRVYCWQFSNAGTLFVRIGGEPRIIQGSTDLSERKSS